MERKGLLGNLFFITIIIIIVILIAGTGFYFKYKSGSLEFGAGNVVVNINNGGNETPQKNETGVNEEIPANETEGNFTIEEINETNEK